MIAEMLILTEKDELRLFWWNPGGNYTLFHIPFTLKTK